MKKTEIEETIREPLLDTQQKGGFKTLPFIIVNESFEKVASYGLLPNMVLYLTREYRLQTSEAANLLFLWAAATNLAPILGAFLADSYVGRYPMIGFGSIASLVGMSLLWLTAMIPGARPPPCDQLSGTCEPATAFQLLFVYICFCVMSVGAGGIRSSSLAFGADQLVNKKSMKSSRTLESYFSWYYVSISVSVIIALTFIVYIQENLGWKVGFGVPVVLMFFSALSFFLATSFYIKFNEKASFVNEFARVIVASYKNRHIKLSPNAADEMYYCKKESVALAPSDKLRFLNKACIIQNTQQDLTSDGSASDPWGLCDVEQVEALKALIKVIPIWFAGVISCLIINQNSFTVLQASSMNRHITSNFEIPAGSFTVFLVLSLTVCVTIYDIIILPLASKIKGKSVRLGLKIKIGIGLALSTISMAALAFVEYNRRKMANQSAVQISAMWLVPHFVLAGLAESFGGIGLNEFFYSELPKNMASVSSNLYQLEMGVANLLASLIVNVVDKTSKTGGDESWVSSDINKGHYDYYYWLLFGLGLVNLIYYVVCSKSYGPCKGEVNGEDLGEKNLG